VVVTTASDEGKMTEYPNHEFLVSAKWLKQHITDNKLVILDVRADKYYDGSPIPGAIRLPWTVFRYDDVDANIREKFVGPQKAQEILGNTGIARSDDLVLYGFGGTRRWRNRIFCILGTGYPRTLREKDP
jgi:thiosulfate/3-mercaptopyruvate sulfurtransferase